MLINKPGTVTLTASYNGGLCESSTFSASIKVKSAPNIINFTAPKTTIRFDPTEGHAVIEYTASASSNLPVILTSSDPSVVKIEFGILKAFRAGTCSITATQNGGGMYDAAIPISIYFTIETFSKLTASLEWYPNTDSFKYIQGSPLKLAFSSTSLPIFYDSSNPSVILSKGAYCEITSKGYLDQAGSSDITAKILGNDLYKSASITKTINIRKKTRNIIWEESSTRIPSYYDTQFLSLPKTSDNSSGCFSYYDYNRTILSADLCDGKLTLLKAGQTSITVSGAENHEYYGSTNTITKTLNFIKQTQTVASTGALTSIYSENLIINPLYAVNNSAYSSKVLNSAWTGRLNPSKIIYTSSNPNVLCPSDKNGNLDLQGNYLKTIKPGTVTITGIAPGNDLIESATGVTTHTIIKRTPTINFIKIPQEDQTTLMLGKALKLRASSNVDSKIQYVSSNPSVASILNEDLLLINTAGSTDIKAKAIEDDFNYSAEVSQKINIVKIENPVTVNDFPILRFGTDASLNVDISDSSLLSNVTFSNPIVGNYSYASRAINVNLPGKTSVIFSFNENGVYNSKIITKQLIVKGPPYVKNSTIYTKISQPVNYILDISNDNGDFNEPISINQNNMPNYFRLSSKTITGFYNMNGTYTGNLSLSNSYAATGQDIIFQIAPIITGIKNISTKVDNRFSFPIGTSGIVNYYTGINLPRGLSVINNYITGTPTERGIFSSDVTIGYNDGINFNKTTEKFNFEIRKNLPVVLIPESNITGYVGYPFDYKILYNEDPNRSPESFSVNSLPNGLLLNSIDGLIYGKSKRLGTFPIEIKAYNNGGESNTGMINFVFLANTSDLPCLK